MPAAKHTIGVDLGGTNMQIGVVSGSGSDARVIARAKKKTKAAEGQEAVIARLAEGVQEACQEAKVPPSELVAIGIGAPGVIDPATGTVLEAVNLRWNDVPLAQLVKDRFKVPVVVDNDVNVAVYGEYRLGAGDNAKNLLGVWLGTGVGGGLILNGQLHYGDFFSGGEIGHTTLFPRAAAGFRSFEQNCSRTSVVERLVRLIESNHKSILPELADGDLSEVKSKTVAKAYQAGDALTVEVVDDTAELIGIAIASAVTLLSLGRVVLGGGLTEALGEPLVERVRRTVRDHVFPHKAQAVKVVATKLLDDAGVLGSAMLAQEAIARKK
jgi:glucokinase